MFFKREDINAGAAVCRETPGALLLDVRQLLGILSPREAAEQEIRLIMLRKQAQADGKKHEDVTVRFIDTDGAEA